jgi:DNA-binding Lrp family transcriptional regulator
LDLNLALRAEYKYAQALYGAIQVIPLVVAYVLITTATGKEGYVLEQMRKLPGLSEVHQLFGQFDLIARMETKDYDVLCDEVLGRVRTISGVTGSRTLICARFKRD